MSTHSPNRAANIDRLRIATACPINWDEMTGDNRVRFCGHRQLNVYNIAELSRTEAESLIASTEGRICARLYRRADGTVLTKDCPVGLRALRMRISKRAAAVFAAIVSISSAAFGQQSTATDGIKACTQQVRISSTNAGSAFAARMIFGMVRDPNGASVLGANVTLTNAVTHEVRSAITNESGKFEFASISAGSYIITIEALYFKRLEILNVTVEADKILNVDTTLEITDEPLTGVIDVRPFVELPQPGTTIISGDIIRRLPIQ